MARSKPECARRTARAAAVLFALSPVMVACGVAGAPSPSSSPSPPPAALDTATPGSSPTASPLAYVRIDAICTFTVISSSVNDGEETVVEDFACWYDATDARLTGRWKARITTTFAPQGSAAARWEGTATITNDGGTWTGDAVGALAFTPDHPTAPFNYGLGTYKGAGAYAGLYFHEYLGAWDTKGVSAGWIDESPRCVPDC